MAPYQADVHWKVYTLEPGWSANEKLGIWHDNFRLARHSTGIRQVTHFKFPSGIGGCRDIELPSQTLFELSCPIARYGQVRVFAILQTNIQRSTGERRDFLDPLHVHHRAPVDAEEFLWIEFISQCSDRVVHAVRLAFRDCISQFVLGVEMRHPC